VQFNRYAFLPTVDKKVILSDPKKFLEDALRGSVSVPSPVPYLTGVNQNDGTQVVCKWSFPFIKFLVKIACGYKDSLIKMMIRTHSPVLFHFYSVINEFLTCIIDN
jgi:hypothetical protein